jgi:PTS system mannose-specific IIC component
MKGFFVAFFNRFLCPMIPKRIGKVTPGGQMPADLNFVAYPAIALAILSNSSTEVAVTLATTIGVIGTIVFNFFQV